MSRLLDQLRNAALTRPGNTPQENGSSPAVPADVNTASSSSSLLVQAIQGGADVGRKTLADEAAQARAVAEQRAQAEADACAETEREAQRAASAKPRSDQVARHHHLPRIAIAAMIAAGMFGLGYWTGLPDPGAPKASPVINKEMPAQLQLRLERDVEALGKRLETAGGSDMRNQATPLKR